MNGIDFGSPLWMTSAVTAAEEAKKLEMLTEEEEQAYKMKRSVEIYEELKKEFCYR